MNEKIDLGGYYYWLPKSNFSFILKKGSKRFEVSILKMNKKIDLGGYYGLVREGVAKNHENIGAID